MPAIIVPEADIIFDGHDGETITETMYRAGYAMRIACRRGGCGLCRVNVDSGDFHFNATVSEQVLPADERDQGITLACRAVPDGDITISMPVDGRLHCIVPMLAPMASRKISGQGAGS